MYTRPSGRHRGSCFRTPPLLLISADGMLGLMKASLSSSSSLVEESHPEPTAQNLGRWIPLRATAKKDALPLVPVDATVSFRCHSGSVLRTRLNKVQHRRNFICLSLASHYCTQTDQFPPAKHLAVEPGPLRVNENHLVLREVIRAGTAVSKELFC